MTLATQKPAVIAGRPLVGSQPRGAGSSKSRRPINRTTSSSRNFRSNRIEIVLHVVHQFLTVFRLINVIHRKALDRINIVFGQLSCTGKASDRGKNDLERDPRNHSNIIPSIARHLVFLSDRRAQQRLRRFNIILLIWPLPKSVARFRFFFATGEVAT